MLTKFDFSSFLLGMKSSHEQFFTINGTRWHFIKKAGIISTINCLATIFFGLPEFGRLE